MKPWHWLRIASGFYAFFAFGHIYGFNWFPSRGVAEDLLFRAMRAYTFDMQGFTRSHWAFYRGFGHLLTVLLVLLCVLSWQLGGLSRKHPEAAKPLTATLLLASIAVCALAWAYFFTAPAVTGTLACLCVAVALVTTLRAPAP